MYASCGLRNGLDLTVQDGEGPYVHSYTPVFNRVTQTYYYQVNSLNYVIFHTLLQ